MWVENFELNWSLQGEKAFWVKKNNGKNFKFQKRLFKISYCGPMQVNDQAREKQSNQDH